MTPEQTAKRKQELERQKTEAQKAGQSTVDIDRQLRELEAHQPPARP